MKAEEKVRLFSWVRVIYAEPPQTHSHITLTHARGLHIHTNTQMILHGRRTAPSREHDKKTAIGKWIRAHTHTNTHSNMQQRREPDEWDTRSRRLE